MAWILIDVALVVLPLALVAVLTLGLWRRVKRLAAASAELMAAQSQVAPLAARSGPTGSTPGGSSPQVDTRRSPTGRR